MILTKEVQIKISAPNVNYYKSKGYDVSVGDTVSIKVEDLNRNNPVKIKVMCDMEECYDTKEIRYDSYLITMSRQGIYRCRKCSRELARKTTLDRYGVPNAAMLPEIKEKVKQTHFEHYGCYYNFQDENFKKNLQEKNIQKYGVPYPQQNEEVKEKTRQTNLLRYGVEYVSQAEEVKEKARNTCLEKYGVDSVLKVPEVQAKILATNMEKYGVEHTSCLPEVKEKFKNTCLQKYGVEYPLQSPEILVKQQNTLMQHYGVKTPMKNKEIAKKVKESLYENGIVATSKPQLYLAKLFNFEINYPIKYWNVDMCDIENKIVVEYDGGGHDLNVKMGTISQEEFDRKEMVRDIAIVDQGYKIIHIISHRDRFPTDDILLKMYSDAFDYFSSTSHTWVKYDIDNGLMINAEHKNGTSYKYGELTRFERSKRYNELQICE